MTVSLSIVIPVAPGETDLTNLLSDLSPWEGLQEILVVVPDTGGNGSPITRDPITAGVPVRRIESPVGRAKQLNRGALAAQGEFLWFLHADTRVASAAWAALQRSLEKHPRDLIYFNLKFRSDGPALVRLNAWGSWLRSHWFKMPFGDQGFCLSKARFQELGGYNESLRYGEDHDFVWTARMAGLNVRSSGASLETSARKYRAHGWWKTTFGHFWRTWKQALPRYGRLLRKRWLP